MRELNTDLIQVQQHNENIQLAKKRNSELGIESESSYAMTPNETNVDLNQQFSKNKKFMMVNKGVYSMGGKNKMVNFLDNPNNVMSIDILNKVMRPNSGANDG